MALNFGFLAPFWLRQLRFAVVSERDDALLLRQNTGARIVPLFYLQKGPKIGKNAMNPTLFVPGRM